MRSILAIIVCVSFFACKTSKSGGSNNSSASLFKHKWMIVALNGEDVDTTKIFKKNGIMFNKETSRISGAVSCNALIGSFVLGENNAFHFKQPLASTKMMCPDMSIENGFMKVVDKVSNYKISGKYLVLTDGDNELAKFVQL
ncbi:heat shock protein HslJ [Chitinophaga skermanii]|uniref:Heat shock protein HslJ n=1 Tax=Chitinophaga skermanii TaxID=331697 RepID=A0A327QQK4_9BACT|nr:META domain-containing protein [Chitinophaga skermanii]RAJ06829.1 heat shock protein HslJ [Chitinophaga skermanii]